MSLIVIHPSLTAVLSTLAALAAYLMSGALVVNRSSPPAFFTMTLVMIAASFVPGPLVALLCMGMSLSGVLYLALDHIHGHCWYDVLTGGKSWHKERLGELAWYRQCVQPAHASWIMVVLGILWAFIFVSELVYLSRKHQNRIALVSKDDEEDSPIAYTAR